MRPRTLGTAAAVLGTALGLGWLLARATTQVVNWFVMTDELFYERLAISVAQTGSLLPRLHGEVISNVNQLYPVVISTVYGNGDVPASLVAAHRLNAYVMASAVIPVYLSHATPGSAALQPSGSAPWPSRCPGSCSRRSCSPRSSPTRCSAGPCSP